MRQKIYNAVRLFHPNRISVILRTLLEDEAIAGKLIILTAILSMIVVNSPFVGAYDSFWHLPFAIGLGSWVIEMDLRHWVNEALMALFFLVVGLEIKRELTHGRLRDPSAALLPVLAAVGGMIVPAGIYFVLNQQGIAAQGWGIPMATDIAFAVGVLSLLGSRVPLNLKIFLLTLAIVDDIGAIIVIAFFYADIIHYGFLAASVILAASMWLGRRWIAGRLALFVVLGIILLITTHSSGIHASVVGAILGLLAPYGKAGATGRSIPERLEVAILPASTFIALPIFAFANAGFAFSLTALEAPGATAVFAGIILGLVVGKLVGIGGAVWLATKFTRAELPEGLGWTHIVGVGLIAGIGFTVSLFITELAFRGDVTLTEAAKIGVFAASILSALLGLLVLRFLSRSAEKS